MEWRKARHVCLFVTFGEELHFSSTCRFSSSVLTFCTQGGWEKKDLSFS